jgi:hypothetical protein
MFTVYFFPGCNQKLLHITPLLPENTFNLTSQATTVNNGTVYSSHKVLQNWERLQTAPFSCLGTTSSLHRHFRFCCRIPWTSSLEQLICGRWKQSERYTIRQLRIFLKETAPEFNQWKLNEYLFQTSIRCSIFQTLVILHRHTIRFLWNTTRILHTGSVTGRRWEIFLKRLLQTV